MALPAVPVLWDQVAEVVLPVLAISGRMNNGRYRRHLQDREWVHRRHRAYRAVTEIYQIQNLSARRAAIHWPVWVALLLALLVVLDRCSIRGQANSCMSTRTRCGALDDARLVVAVPLPFRL